MSTKPNIVEIKPEHTKAGKVVNALQFTIRRMQNLLGFGVSPDGKRDYNQIFGYGADLGYTDYFGMYKRNAIGSTVVAKVAKGCWNETPKIMVGDTQILEDELDQLDKMGFFRALERADILNRIGPFSVLLIGMPDDMDLDQPINKASDIQGLYFNPYNFDGIEITKWDNDPTSQRFQLPELYQLQTTDHGDKIKDVRIKAITVHYSRVIHLAEGALDSDIEGSSALEPVWNSLINILKVTGGSGEAYFKNSRQQRALEADKEARLEKGSDAVTALDENLEAFDNGWGNTLRLQNMKVTHLPIHMISPRDSFDVSVEEVSGQTGIPIRILTGKGGGQTTGKEDRASWNSIIADRRSTECDDYLMQGLKIMAEAGLFELPDNAIVEWPPQASLNESEKSEVNERDAKTLNTLVDMMAKPVGDELKSKSVFAAFGFDEIEADFTEIDDLDASESGDDIIDPKEDLDNE